MSTKTAKKHAETFREGVRLLVTDPESMTREHWETMPKETKELARLGFDAAIAYCNYLIGKKKHEKNNR